MILGYGVGETAVRIDYIKSIKKYKMTRKEAISQLINDFQNRIIASGGPDHADELDSEIFDALRS